MEGLGTLLAVYQRLLPRCGFYKAQDVREGVRNMFSAVRMLVAETMSAPHEDVHVKYTFIVVEAAKRLEGVEVPRRRTLSCCHLTLSALFSLSLSLSLSHTHVLSNLLFFF